MMATEFVTTFLFNTASFWSSVLHLNSTEPFDPSASLASVLAFLRPVSRLHDLCDSAVELSAVRYVLTVDAPLLLSSIRHGGTTSLPPWRSIAASVGSTLGVPPASDYILALQAAAVDVRACVSSLSALLFLTLRPLWNVFVIVAAVLLRIKMAVMAAIVRYHRSMSREAVVIEVGIVAAVVSAVLLRKFIRKKRYFPRLLAIVEAKRRKAKRRYRAMLEKVRKVNQTLALVFPHLLFALGWGFVRWILPGVVRLVAMETSCATILAVWYPVGRTLWMLRKSELSSSEGHGANVNHDGTKNKDPENKADAAKITKPKSNDVTWIKSNDKKPKPKGPAVAASKKARKLPSNSPMGIGGYDLGERDPIGTLVQFWATFGLLQGITSALALFPIIGPALLSNKLLKPLLAELYLCFLLWLHLPTGAVDFLYGTLCVPAATLFGLASSKAAKADRVSVLDDCGELLDPLLSKIASFLDIAIYLRAISKVTKERILRLIVEGYALFPAIVTLLTPSFLTSYGCLYAGHFITVINTVKNAGPVHICAAQKLSVQTKTSCARSVQQVRWLQYWCSYSLFFFLIRQSRAVLAWIPFSTHLRLLIIIWLQLPAFSGASKIYDIMVHELICFGILSPAKSETVKAESTMTNSIIKTITKSLKALPSGASTESLAGVAREVMGHGQTGEGNAAIQNSSHQKGTKEQAIGKIDTNVRTQLAINKESTLKKIKNLTIKSETTEKLQQHSSLPNENGDVVKEQQPAPNAKESVSSTEDKAYQNGTYTKRKSCSPALVEHSQSNPVVSPTSPCNAKDISNRNGVPDTSQSTSPQ